MILPRPMIRQKGQLASTSSRLSVLESRTSPHRLAASTIGILIYVRAKRSPPSARIRDYAACSAACIRPMGFTASAVPRTHFAMMICPEGRMLVSSSTDSILSMKTG